jgi:DNA modification methylase
MGYFSDNIKELLIWDKLTGEPAMLPGVLNSVFELILVFSNDSPEKRLFSDSSWRGTVDNIIRNKKNFDVKSNHHAIMPIDLPRRILNIWSKEGDLIYDPFMGYGTTAIACIREKRNWIGSEISEENCRMANKRIEPFLIQGSLF